MAEVTCDQRRVVQRLLLDAMYPALTHVAPGKYEARIFGRVFDHYMSDAETFIDAHRAVRRKIELEFQCSST